MVQESAYVHTTARKNEMASGPRHAAAKHKLRSAMLHLPKITGLTDGRGRSHYQVPVTPASSSFFYISLCATFLPTVRAFLAPFFLSLMGTVTPLLALPHPRSTQPQARLTLSVDSRLAQGWPLQKGCYVPSRRCAGEKARHSFQVHRLLLL